MGNATPVLWHLKVSHYNEKARWALDYKGIPHVRRALDPGRHQKVARKLSGGSTFPVLQLDGKGLGDSTEIIAELERLRPAPALYPADPAARQRALELEEHFDEELGPYTRLLAVHHAFKDKQLGFDVFVPDLPAVRRAIASAMFPRVRKQIDKQFGIDEQSVAEAFDKLREAGAVLRFGAGPAGYLCGDKFTVADLTLASLLAPLVCPNQFPYSQPQRDHPLFAPVRKALRDAGVDQWTREMYFRHRGLSAEILPGDGDADHDSHQSLLREGSLGAR
jgi:glutathione S-transferase